LVGVIAGVIVAVDPNAPAIVKRAGAQLVADLERKGIDGSLVPDTGFGNDQVEIEVGIKP
jgi:hypothetical protein